MPADPRMTIARIDGDCPQAESSWSEPITLMSCITRGDMPGPGCLTIELCTTVSTSARAISGAMLGSRMSASISSVRPSSWRGLRVSSPTIASNPGSRSSLAARRVPR
jgi:hypothetical protein